MTACCFARWEGGGAVAPPAAAHCLPSFKLPPHPSPTPPPPARSGTQDATISKTLLLHLPTRHPSSYPELDISPLVQAASLAGVGLLFQGSCHR